MGGKIECYLDLASLYSYLAFLDLRRNKPLLDAHKVEVEFHPVLLGGINAGSGNRPPWTLPAKAKYGVYDARRSIGRHPGLQINFPDDLFSLARTQPALRALHYIKRHYPSTTYLTAFHYLFYLFWSPPKNADLTTAQNVAAALASVPRDFDGKPPSASSPKLFTEQEVKEIMQAAGSEEYKNILKKTTQEALEKGAFGNPWLWVTNEKGESEPFFGSDRFHFVYQFLGLPYRDVTLLPPGGEKAKI